MCELKDEIDMVDAESIGKTLIELLADSDAAAENQDEAVLLPTCYEEQDEEIQDEEVQDEEIQEEQQEEQQEDKEIEGQQQQQEEEWKEAKEEQEEEEENEEEEKEEEKEKEEEEEEEEEITQVRYPSPPRSPYINVLYRGLWQSGMVSNVLGKLKSVVLDGRLA